MYILCKPQSKILTVWHGQLFELQLKSLQWTSVQFLTTHFPSLDTSWLKAKWKDIRQRYHIAESSWPWNGAINFSTICSYRFDELPATTHKIFRFHVCFIMLSSQLQPLKISYKLISNSDCHWLLQLKNYVWTCFSQWIHL